MTERKNHAGFKWDGEPDELLRKLRDEGYSGSKAAEILAEHYGVNITRNAVISRSNRMGYPMKSIIPKARKQSTKQSVKRREAPCAERNGGIAPSKLVKVARDDSPEAFALPESRHVTLLELEPRMCRFPLGDPRTEEFRFCGADAQTGIPYCAGHSQVAYTSPEARRKALTEQHKDRIRYALKKRGHSPLKRKVVAA